ncbi:hypothetical protein [uncultured Litoreibacter sp.]|uniref:hypothetical protein n=1 Tax=uncultured Litoreibacter sp. TaxID=1392394 RepID=UPI0026244508|nr:hypothetical protein [uncultured Litoreibacter sp.]
MFTTTPIGSCRITTPLRRGQSTHGFHLNMERCYGYCHSPAEAVQMARFMRGEADIPHDVWPLVSRKHDLNTLSARRHAMSDLYVVELASAKEVTIDGVSVQLNYLNATFADFFADRDRAQAFWALTEAGNDADIAAFLDTNWSDTDAQRAETATLGKIRLSFVTEAGLRKDIDTLTELLPDVLFVSHVDACKADGTPIRSRSNFIQMVADQVKTAGYKFYNPTELMHEFGQTAAIEDESAGLAHFTDGFAHGMMDEWMHKVIAPKTDATIKAGAPHALDHHLKPQIHAAIDSGQFLRADARLASLAAHGVDVGPLHQATKTQQEHARAQFQAEDHSHLTADEQVAQIIRASELGLFDDALTLASSLPGGLAGLPTRTLLQIGDLAHHGGELDTATEAYVATAKTGLARACHALANMACEHGIDMLAKFAPQERQSFLATVPAADRLDLLELNGAPFAQAIFPETTAQEAADIVAKLTETHGIGYAAEVLAIWREQQGADKIRDAGLNAILDGWVTTALQFDERIDRIHGLNAVLFAAPLFQRARIEMRDLRKELALLIRAAGKEGDIDQLDAFSTEAAALAKELPELDLWRARLRFGLGEYATAMQLGQAAAQFMPEKINVWVLLMRAAKKGNFQAEAVEFARKVTGLACPDTEAFKTEAEAVLHAKAVGA